MTGRPELECDYCVEPESSPADRVVSCSCGWRVHRQCMADHVHDDHSSEDEE